MLTRKLLVISTALLKNALVCMPPKHCARTSQAISRLSRGGIFFHTFQGGFHKNRQLNNECVISRPRSPKIDYSVLQPGTPSLPWRHFQIGHSFVLTVLKDTSQSRNTSVRSNGHFVLDQRMSAGMWHTGLHATTVDGFSHIWDAMISPCTNPYSMDSWKR